MLAACAAYWAIPYRLAFGPGGSYFSVGYQPGEYECIQRLQPLIAGTTANNTVNGVEIPAVHSMNFFDDALRPILSALHVDAVAFAWAWRIMLPIGLGALFFLIVRECSPRGSAALPLALAAAALIAIPAAAELIGACGLIPKPYTALEIPLYYFPQNIEFLISAGLVWLMLRFLKRPILFRAILLAALTAATLYLRPYSALVWLPTALCVFVNLWLRGRFPLRSVLAATGMLAVCLAPWFAILRANWQSLEFQGVLARAYGVETAGRHPQWLLYLVVAGALFGATLYVSRGWRPFLESAAIMLALYALAVGRIPYSRELLSHDVIGHFYGVLLIAAALMLLSGIVALAGRAAAAPTLRPVCLFGIIASVLVVYCNLGCDFRTLRNSPYSNVVLDTATVPAYRWIAEHASGDAVFLVDDGYDWSPKGSAEDAAVLTDIAPDRTEMLFKSDLFQLVARRKRVFNERLIFAAVPNADFLNLMLLQRGTFGFPVELHTYDLAAMQYWPEFIIWRRRSINLNSHGHAAIPRGYGENLKVCSTTVYEDNACEVWQLNFSLLRPVFPGPVKPLPPAHPNLFPDVPFSPVLPAADQ